MRTPEGDAVLEDDCLPEDAECDSDEIKLTSGSSVCEDDE